MNERTRLQLQADWDESVPVPDLSNRYGLEPAAIPSEWILEGDPITRCRRLWGSTDDMAFTVMWDCTAGRFNWFYDIDETICVMEGSVTLTDVHGQRYTLEPTDTFYFPCGSRYHWTVPVYVRKVAFVHVPLSPKLRYAKRIYRSMKGWVGLNRSPGAAEGERRGAALGGH